MMDFWDPWVRPSLQSRLTGAEAERFEAGRPIARGFFDVFRLTELTRRQDAGEPVLRLVRDPLSSVGTVSVL